MGVDVFVNQALERFLDFAVFMGELHGVSVGKNSKVLSSRAQP
jgi:hypothetical protein